MKNNVSARYLGEQGREYETARQPDRDDPGYLIDFAYFKPYLGTGQRVLDFGCGNGGILRQIQKNVGVVDGVEVNPAAREVARSSGVNVYDSVESIPVGTEYDVIISNHVFEHVRDVCGTLEKLRRLLRPGGKLILKLPFDDSNARYQQAWSVDDIDHHLYTWTPRLLANLLTETGYGVQSCELVTSAWHPKLFPFCKFGLQSFVFWMFAIVKRRRQTFAVATNPGVS
jgi:2-polyprenyl-3-methyl-5-hydroxy-6-metoxy-1,4-benzoquinol methylase